MGLHLLHANAVKKQISTNGATPRIVRLIVIANHLGQDHVDDSPRDPLLIFQPAELPRFFIPAIGEFLPVLVHIYLGLAAETNLEDL
jgi:hypothetical protein